MPSFAPFVRVIRLEPGPQPVGVDPDDGIDLRVEGRTAAAHFERDRILLDRVLLARQRLVDDEPQERLQPEGPRERGAAGDLLDLLTDNGGGRRGGHAAACGGRMLAPVFQSAARRWSRTSRPPGD